MSNFDRAGLGRSKTQLSLKQLTGSFGNAVGKIRDDLSAPASHAAIVTGSLAGNLSHILSQVKRIHGGGAGVTVGTGSLASAGSYLIDAATTIILDADSGGIDIRDGGTKYLNINQSSNDVVLKPLQSDKDIIFQEDGGNEIARLDSSAESLKMASTKKIEFGSTTEFIHRAGTGQVDLDANLKVLIDAPTLDVEAETAINLKSDAITFGEGGAQDIVLNFSTSGQSGMITWQSGSSEDYFEYNDDILLASSEKLYLGDTGAYLRRKDETAGQAELFAGKVGITGSNASADAVEIGNSASAGGVKIGAGTAGLDVDTTGTVAITSSKAGADVIKIEATAGDGGILVDFGSGGIQFSDDGGSTDLLNIDGDSADFHSTVQVNVDNTTDSTSTSTGGLVVDGGVGIAKNLFIGGSGSIAGDLVVTGDLLVSGDTTNVNTTNLHVEDTLLLLGSGSTSAGDRGIVFRQTATAGQVLAYDQSEDAFVFGDVDNDPAVLTGEVNTYVADSHVAVRGLEYQVNGSTNKLHVTASDLHMLAAQDAVLDAARHIRLNAELAEIHLKDGTVKVGEFGLHGSNLHISSSVSDKDIIFMVNDGGTMTQVASFDGSAASLLMDGSKKIEFGGTTEFIHKSAANTLDIDAAATMNLDAPTVNIAGETAINLQGDAVTFGEAGSQPVVLNFNTGGNDGIITWNSGSGDHFKFGDDILIEGTERLYFNDTGVSLHSSENGQLDIAADGSMADAIDLNASAGGVKVRSALDNAASIYLDSAAGVQVDGGDQNDTIQFNNSPLGLQQISAPTTVTSKLYNLNHVSSSLDGLTWDGGRVFTSKTRVKSSATITTSSAAPVPVVVSGLSHDAGEFPGLTDIYLNGQLMLSGTSATNGDYKIHGGLAQNVVQFFFQLDGGDVVTVVRN